MVSRGGGEEEAAELMVVRLKKIGSTTKMVCCVCDEWVSTCPKVIINATISQCLARLAFFPLPL